MLHPPNQINYSHKQLTSLPHSKLTKSSKQNAFRLGHEKLNCTRFSLTSHP